MMADDEPVLDMTGVPLEIGRYIIYAVSVGRRSSGTVLKFGLIRSIDRSKQNVLGIYTSAGAKTSLGSLNRVVAIDDCRVPPDILSYFESMRADFVSSTVPQRAAI